jgi:hypothetical protein
MNYEINVNEISKMHYNKEEIRLKTFDKILERCYFRIKYSVTQELNYCIFQVPEFVIGTPLYNMKKCLYYIGLKLMKNEFKINVHNPNTLFIHWILKKPKHNNPLLLTNSNSNYNYNNTNTNTNTTTNNNYREITNNCFDNDNLFNNFIPKK